MAPLTDDQITKMAKARVSFKVHAFTYLVVNLFLMAIWMMTSNNMPMYGNDWNFVDYWPMWTHLGWGLGLAIHGFMVYGPASGMQSREEEKLRQQMAKK